MAGERQTEPDRADRPIARSDRRLAAELPRALSVVTAADHDGETDALRTELARVRAERDQATAQVNRELRKIKTAEARAESQVAEIVTLIRSYTNVHMTKALADLIEHKYIHGEENSA